MSAEGAPGRVAYAGEEIFFQTLCEQVDGVYRTYRRGQLNLNPGIQQALEHVNAMLAEVRPEEVGALTALRARIASAQADEMVAVLEQFNGARFPVHLRELAATTPVPSAGAVATPVVVADPAPTGSHVSQAAPARGRRTRWMAAAAATVLAVAGYLAFGTGGSGDRGSLATATQRSPVKAKAAAAGAGRFHAITGQVVIVAYSQKERIVYPVSRNPGHACQGAGGLSDMTPGQTVSVDDGSGRMLASGRLGAGMSTSVGTQSSSKPACTFAFTIPNVPNATSYRLSFGGRGPVAYSYQQLAATDWSPSITLGP